MGPDTEIIAGYEVYTPQAAADHKSATTNTKSAHPLGTCTQSSLPSLNLTCKLADQLSIAEITQAAEIVRTHFKGTDVKFNAITLKDPIKAEYIAFRDHGGPRPDRRAFVIVFPRGSCEVNEILVSVTSGKVLDARIIHDVLPILTLEDLDVCERVARADPRVIEMCKEIGLHDMSRVFFDGWAVGADERYGFDRRLQQGLAYWRSSKFDNQYAHPLDFTVVIDTEKEEVLRIDVRRVDGKRVPVPRDSHNFLPEFIQDSYNTTRLKPVDITQPQGVSFTMDGNQLSWAGFHMHIGFNYREGIVISDVSVDDMYENRRRMIFNRLSVAEMVVPYGNPDIPHHRKHAFDIGEYGMGLMTNPLRVGCDCKGAIKYLDAIMSSSHGYAAVLPNAVCIHEEDNGLLYKHTDYRDGKVVSARDRRLIISQVITAANYEYGFYHTFTLDGTYKLEVKLTGILNTAPLAKDEEAVPFGTRVAKGLNAHNHQHIFSLRIDPAIDGPKSTVVQNDAMSSEVPVGESGNLYGNAFYCKKTPLKTSKEGACDYNHHTSRTWDIINPNKINPACNKPVGYKIISRESPPLLCKPGSLVWRRAGFTRKVLWVTKYREDELFPAGNYVCQSTGQPGWPSNETVVDWSERNDNIENEDIICWLQFGITHFPRTEDFPLMPAEPLSIMLRASNFFEKNPALWVPPTSHEQDTTSKDLNKCCNDTTSGATTGDGSRRTSKL
jgi:primary-amine oxidase